MPERVYASHALVFSVCRICALKGSDVALMVMVAGGPDALMLSSSNRPQSRTVSLPSLFQFSRTKTAWMARPVVAEASELSSAWPPSTSWMYWALT